MNLTSLSNNFSVFSNHEVTLLQLAPTGEKLYLWEANSDINAPHINLVFFLSAHAT